jgi:GNAT superfamily N-acetyltransferase
MWTNLRIMQIKHIDNTVQENIELLKRLQKDCLPYDKVYDVSNGAWWVAYQDGKPIAFAGVVRSSRWNDTGYLCRSGVIRSARGRGVQKRLIRVRQLYAKKMGWSWLISDTYHNPPSSNSLISCGFRLFDPTNPWGAKGTLYWRKKL